MLLRMQPDATPSQTACVRAHLEAIGYETVALGYLGAGVFAALPAEETAEAMPEGAPWAALQRACPEAEAVARLEAEGNFALGQRARRPGGTRVRGGGTEIGGDAVVVVAGPCSVESREQVLATALAVREAGAQMLRGGAYKPRTSTYDFQGLGRTGLKLLAEAGARAGLPVVTEVMSAEDAELVAEHADLLQVGARNMQNFPLLKRLGRLGRPVLLKRAPSATLTEWLAAAEYMLARGNDQVVLCERGIRGFDGYTRNTLDVAAVAAVKELSHLPVLADPSHGTGRRSLVGAGARAAIAAGADGVCLEVHVRPEESVSDREQALGPGELARIVAELGAVSSAVGRRLG